MKRDYYLDATYKTDILWFDSNVALLLQIPTGQVRQTVSAFHTCGPTRDQQVEAIWADLGYPAPARLIPEMHDKHSACTNKSWTVVENVVTIGRKLL